MEVLIKNGLLVNADSSIKADVLCRDGKIQKIEESLKSDSVPDQIIDAGGCYVIPGGIDPHVHMHLPTPAGFSSDDYFSGSKAALYGGTTTIIDFVTPKKGQFLADAIEQRRMEAANCLTDYSFHVSPIEWRPSMEQEIQDVMHKEGFKSFKVYMAYKDTIGLDDDVMFRVMKTVGISGGMVTVHCELGDDIEELRNGFADKHKLSPGYHPLSRPARLEAGAVKKAIELAKRAQCPLYIVHVSTKESLQHIHKAQKEGQKVMAETCPQYLLLDDTRYDDEFNHAVPFIMSPPLRKKDDNDALWKAVGDTTIHTIGTDHCPFTLKQKETGKNDFRKIPNGAGGIEHRLALLYTFGVLSGKISMNKFVSLCSTNSAKIFGLYPSKGVIAVGSDADIVVWNPNKETTISVETHHQNCDINIYENTKTMGEASFVLSNGNIAIYDGELNDNIKSGKLLKTYSF